MRISRHLLLVFILCLCLLESGAQVKRIPAAHAHQPKPIASPTPRPIPPPKPALPEFYVSADALLSGDGSLANPWSLPTICGGDPGFGWPLPPAAIMPGSILILRGGTYVPPTPAGGDNHGHPCYFSGTANKPIIMTAYPGERAVIDRRYSSKTDSMPDSAAALLLGGAYVYAIGLEITNSDPDRTVPRPEGLVLKGVGTKAINNLVQDSCDGIWPESAALDAEVYGNIIFRNGTTEAGPNGTCHGIYMQNTDANRPKLVRENIVLDNYSLGIQAYTGSSDVLRGFKLVGNVVANNGSPVGQVHEGILIGGTRSPVYGLIEDSNFLFNNGLQIGYFQPTNNDAVITNNLIAGYSQLSVLNQWASLTVRGNRIVHPNTTGVINITASQPWNWNSNTYQINNAIPFSGFLSFDQWRVQTGFDNASTFSQTLPTGVEVFIRPNAYDSNRSNVIVYNWDGGAASVDLRLPLGTVYRLMDPKDFFGAPVVSGLYRGPLSLNVGQFATYVLVRS